MKRKIYIAGKISGLQPADVKRKFTHAETRLRALGFEPVNPVEICKDIPWNDWAACMRRGIAALMDCDTILLLEDWENSKGAMIEESIAYKVGIERVFSIAELMKDAITA